ncbi:MAG: hypothetical protein QM520_02905 [Gammaproteobacteria bacterium]|nr:hypothetical protein [Gammaproteobacteria bacterium]
MYFFPGLMKLQHGLPAPDWFMGLDFPFPQNYLPVSVNWLMAGVGEVLLAILLLTPLSGLAALGLLYITFVAVYTSHFDALGWSGWNDPSDGFKIPLMYALMLATIFFGKIKNSIDIFTRKKFNWS